MKKVIWKEKNCETTTVYFDFGKDFPQPGLEWIVDVGGYYTDYDWAAGDEMDKQVMRKIAILHHEDCDEDDYEYVRDLMKEEWGL